MTADLSPRLSAELDFLNRVEGPQRAEAILIAHQRRDVGSCLCGWAELGRSHAGHQVAMLREGGVLPSEPPALANVSHGHVRPRPDGAKARCGGPGICSQCSAEQAQLGSRQ